MCGVTKRPFAPRGICRLFGGRGLSSFRASLAGLLPGTVASGSFGATEDAGTISMKETQFVPPEGAFTRTVKIRFSHCDPGGIVYFPHYCDMFNGLIEDWYTEHLRSEEHTS